MNLLATRRLHWAQRVSLSSYLGLLLVFTLTTLWWVPAGKQPNPLIWLVHVVPLLLFAPGLWRHRPRSYAWLCFVCLLYFCITVTNLFSPLANGFDVLELVLLIVLFCSAIVTIRWQSALRRQAETTIPLQEMTGE